VFNLEFLEQQIDEMQRRLISSPLRISAWRYWIHRKVFGIRWVAQGVFWSRNLVMARQLSAEFSAYMQSTRKRPERHVVPEW
jgi:hypothetical protein